jgi:hypothetical protein
MFLTDVTDGLEIGTVYLTPLRHTFRLQRSSLVHQKLLLQVKFLVPVSSDAVNLTKVFGVCWPWRSELR